MKNAHIFAFWSRVLKTDTCWLWQGHCSRNGYGQTSFRSGSRLAHIFSWRLHNGEVPDGLKICHSCDIRNCVNPSHLWVGTQADNVADRDNKGRWRSGWYDRRGERNPRAKLNLEQVASIILRRREGSTKLGREYGVAPSTIRRAIAGSTWAEYQGG